MIRKYEEALTLMSHSYHEEYSTEALHNDRSTISDEQEAEELIITASKDHYRFEKSVYRA